MQIKSSESELPGKRVNRAHSGQHMVNNFVEIGPLFLLPFHLVLSVLLFISAAEERSLSASFWPISGGNLYVVKAHIIKYIYL